MARYNNSNEEMEDMAQEIIGEVEDKLRKETDKVYKSLSKKYKNKVPFDVYNDAFISGFELYVEDFSL